VSQKRFLLCGLFLLAGSVLGAQQQQTTPRPGTPAAQPAANAPAQQPKAKISGTVTKAGSGEPVRKASVTLMPNNAGGGGQANRGQQGPGQIPQQAQGGGQQQNQPGQANQAQNGQQNQQGQQRGAGAGSVRSVTTGDDGSFSFPDIAAGTYRLRVDRGWISLSRIRAAELDRHRPSHNSSGGPDVVHSDFPTRPGRHNRGANSG
jgi:hypothetical protein